MRRKIRARWIAVILLVGIGAFIALDVVILRYHESRAATEIARAAAAERVNVDLGSSPFLPSFLRGRLTEVEVRVVGASATGGLRVQEVRTRASGVSFSWQDISSLVRSRFATRTEVSSEEIFGVLELSASDLEDFISRRVPVVEEVHISSAGIQVTFRDPLAPFDDDQDAEPVAEEEQPRARYLPRVEDGRLVLRLVGLAQLPDRFRSDASAVEAAIDLPQLPPGLRSDVRLGDGVVIVEVTGRDLDIEVGEGRRDD